MSKTRSARPKRKDNQALKDNDIQQPPIQPTFLLENGQPRLRERYATKQEVRERLKQLPPDRRKRLKEMLSKPGVHLMVIEGRPYTEEEMQAMRNTLHKATIEEILEAIHS